MVDPPPPRTRFADFSLSGKRVARELDLLIAAHGKPRAIVSDNGTELTSNAIVTLQGPKRPSFVSLAMSQKGKNPTTHDVAI